MAALHRGVLKSRRRQQLVGSNQYAPRPYKQQRKHMQSYCDSLKSSIWPNKLEDQVEYDSVLGKGVPKVWHDNPKQKFLNNLKKFYFQILHTPQNGYQPVRT